MNKDLEKTKIRVCIISPTFPCMNCAVGDYTFELVRSLKNYGLEVGIITSDHEKIKQAIKDSHAQNINLFPIIKHWNFSCVTTILRKIKDFRPDIIHIQYHWWNFNHGFPLKGIMAVLLPLILKLLNIKIPIITTLHSRLNGPYLFPKAWILRRWALIPLLIFSNRIVVTNRFDGKKLTQWPPFLKNKIDYIVGGTGHYLSGDNLKEEVFKIRQEFKDSDDEIILSNFGFMIPYKGLEELLSAIHTLRSKGYRLKLLAIGGFDIEVNFAGSYFNRLRQMAKDLNLESYIRWTGFCDSRQASIYLLASDICVMPFTDGASEWRSSFLDALSHGLPVITTQTERTPEDLVDKVNCLLVQPKDAKRLAAAIEELINSKQLRVSLGKAAFELYRSEYDWPVIVRKTINSYTTVLNHAVNHN